LYYNEVLLNANIDGQTPSEIAKRNRKNTSMPTLNSLGGGRATQNAYVTSLYSPDSYAEAKITLLGDPDFLVQEHRGGPEAVYNRFYGSDGFRISANGGQVFIEIDFKEAIDYNDGTHSQEFLEKYNISESNTGVMSLNDSILFFKYPAWAEEVIKGVSYKVVTVASTFADGRFTQELSCVINIFPDDKEDSESEKGKDKAPREGEKKAGDASGGTPTGGG
jgi:hypothetical protein